MALAVNYSGSAAGQSAQPFFTELIVTGPVIKGVRWMAPRVVLDRHIPLAALVLLASAWMVATVVKVDICLRVGIEQCR